MQDCNILLKIINIAKIWLKTYIQLNYKDNIWYNVKINNSKN